MGFLNQSVLQKKASTATTEKHPLLKDHDVPLDIKRAYLQGCVVAVLEHDDGKVTNISRQEIDRLGLSLGLPSEEISETISVVCEINSPEAQEELLNELFSTLRGDVYPRYFMKDFERLLTRGGFNSEGAMRTLDLFGSSLISGTGDWRGRLREYELAEKRALISAKVYRQGDTKTITLPGGATIELIYCTPGEFVMGCPRSDLKMIYGDDYEDRFDGESYDENVHKVRLSKGFWLGRYPVTIGQWKSVVEDSVNAVDRFFSLASSDRDFKDWQITKDNLTALGDKHPVCYVSWQQCKNFATKISRRLGLEVRLPTEAEWEYACRAGDPTNIVVGINEKANIGSHYRDAGLVGGLLGLESRSWEQVDPPREVGLGLQNRWGFYDMLGNVREWCSDVYDRFATDEAIDPKGPLSGSVHVCRGASDGDSPADCRPSRRSKKSEDERGNIGLRLVFETVDTVELPEQESHETTIADRNDKVLDFQSILAKVCSIKDEAVRRYGKEALTMYGYIAGSAGVVLLIGFSVRWWLATILAGIATARFGAVVNHGGFECLLPMVSLVIAMILFFMGV